MTAIYMSDFRFYFVMSYIFLGCPTFFEGVGRGETLVLFCHNDMVTLSWSERGVILSLSISPPI